MRYITLLIFIISTCFSASSQDVNKYRQDYEHAKELMEEGRYGLARDMFQNLATSESEHPYGIYASFFYAVCAKKEGYNALARDMFFQISRKYPDWEHIDEVNHWLSVIFFESDNYYRGFEYGQNIEDREIKKENLETQRYFLAQINQPDSLVDLYNVFPENPAIAEKLIDLQMKLPFSQRNFELIENISDNFPLLKLNISEEMPESEMKDVYTVSLLLPVVVDRLSLNASNKPNEFVFDLYRGIQMAVDSLNHDDKRIDLRIYDTKRDSATIKNILDQPELAESDLIIGPLYHAELIHEFSRKNKINVLHPLSNNIALVRENPYYHLFTSSDEDIVLKAVEFIKNDTTLNRGIIFHPEKPRDEYLAQMFTDSLNNLEDKSIRAISIGINDEKKVLETLTSGTVINRLTEKEDRIGQDSLDFIYVFALDNPVSIYSDVLTAVEARGDSVFILGSNNWINDNVIDPDRFARLNVHFTDPEFIDVTSESYTHFEKKYIVKYGSVPNEFSIMGFESMFYFGKNMINHGDMFQYDLAEEEITSPGILMSPKNYYRSNTNKYIPIITWNGRSYEQLKLKKKEDLRESSK